MEQKGVVAIVLAIVLFTGIVAVAFPSVDAGKGVRIVGTMKDDGRILLLAQNASPNTVYKLEIQSFGGNIGEAYLPDNWEYGKKSGRIIELSTDSSPLHAKGSMRFHITVDSGEDQKLKFKWNGYAIDGTLIAKGAFKIINRAPADLLPVSTVTTQIQRKASLCSWDGWWTQTGGHPRSYLINGKVRLCDEHEEPVPDADVLVEMVGPYKASGTRWIATDSKGTAVVSFTGSDAGPYTLTITKVTGKYIEYEPSNDTVSSSLSLLVAFPNE